MVQEAAAVGRERRETRELEEALMAHTSSAAALLGLTPGSVSQLLKRLSRATTPYRRTRVCRPRTRSGSKWTGRPVSPTAVSWFRL